MIKSTKLKLLMLCLLSGLSQVMAKDFYVSTVNSNASDANPGTQEMPWKSLAKVNEMMASFKAGDRILFERGSVFYGSLTIRAFGSSGNPIIFRDYGSGALPRINGTIPLNGFQDSDGDRIWEATCTNCDNPISLVMRDQTPLSLGRYPNLDQPNAGYLSIDQDSKSAYRLIDWDFGFAKDFWKGAEVIIRPKRWALNAVTISGNNSSNIYLEDLAMRKQPNFSVPAGFGFFIQKHIGTLDQEGEWYYDPALKKLYIYSQENLSQANIRVGQSNYLLEINRQQHIEVFNLHLEASNGDGIEVYNSSQVYLHDISLNIMGKRGYDVQNVDEFRMENCRLENAFDAAGTFNGSNHQIRHNVFRKVGLTRGLGFYYGGISVDVDNLILERNTVQEIGYVGITFSGNNLLIQENDISDVCKILDDGGGIYSYNGDETRNADQNRVLRRNFIRKVNQAAEGAAYLDPLSAGIYMDSGVQNVEISDNSIRDCIGPGIYLHNARHNRIRANNLYFNSTGISIVDDQTSHIRSNDNLITQNKVLMIDKDKQSIEVINLKDDLPLKNLATLDSNYYVDPFYNSRVRYLQSLENLGVLTLEKWKTLFGQDLNTKGTPFIYPTFSIERYLDSNLVQNGSFQDEMDQWYCQKDCNLAIEQNQVSFGHNQSAQAVWPYVELVQNLPVNEVGYYEFKFKARAAKSGSNIYFYLRQNTSPYKKLSDLIFAPLTQDEEEYSFFIETYQIEKGASLVIRASNIDGQVWMDDISLRPVVIKERNINDLIQVVDNPSDQPMRIDLSQSSFLSLDQVYYSQGSQASVGPYQSVALLKVEDERGTNSEPPLPSLNSSFLNSIQLLDPLNAVEIQWTDNNQNELGYLIERRGETGDFQILDSLPLNTELYVDKAPLPNQINFYRIKAYNAEQEASVSDSLGVDLGLKVEEVNLVEGYETIPVYPLGNDIQIDQKLLAAFNSTVEPSLTKEADSVYFALSDRLVFGKMDRSPPFRFMSQAESMALGTYTLKVTPYKDGLQGISKTVDFELVKRKIITSLNLVETNKQENLGNLMDQQSRSINNQSPYGMYAQANDPLITGIIFQMGGKERHYQHEKFRPYSLFGDENNKYKGRVWNQGWYSLQTLVYTQIGPRKVYWDTLTVNFSVKEGEWDIHKILPEEDILQSQNKSASSPNNSPTSTSLNVYPVPAHDFLNIEIPGEFRSAKASIQIFNAGGESVMQEELEITPKKNQVRLSLQSLKRGLYHFQLRLGQEQYSGKFTIQK